MKIVSRWEDFSIKQGQWEAYGLQCRVREIVWDNGTSHYCGYVGLPEGHRLYKETDMDSPAFDDISVHGGITYLDLHDFDGENLLYVGFDCAHGGLDCRNGEEPKSYEHVWTVDEVKAETERLAKQLAEMA